MSVFPENCKDHKKKTKKQRRFSQSALIVIRDLKAQFTILSSLHACKIVKTISYLSEHPKNMNADEVKCHKKLNFLRF